MSLHYVAAAQIALAALFHFVSGGTVRVTQANSLARDAGEGSLSDKSFAYVRYGVFGFIVGSAILLVFPIVPIWVEMILGTSWLVLGLADGVRSRGRSSGLYFALSTGVLILAGNFV